ncbi:MAG: hypothetical protein APR63_02095 [Desulfuromonas sp. SDB]|nr:MAG: hypothetical protein APR63_02095 [Desulfuromonas sp. SDB]
MKNCQRCGETVEQYKKIGDVLQKDEIKLSPDFSANVLKEINLYRNVKETLKEYLFYGVLILISIFTGIIFLNNRSFISTTYRSIVDFFTKLNILKSFSLEQIKLANYNPAILIVIISLTLFIVIQFLDFKFVDKNHL